MATIPLFDQPVSAAAAGEMQPSSPVNGKRA